MVFSPTSQADPETIIAELSARIQEILPNNDAARRIFDGLRSSIRSGKWSLGHYVTFLYCMVGLHTPELLEMDNEDKVRRLEVELTAREKRDILTVVHHWELSLSAFLRHVSEYREAQLQIHHPDTESQSRQDLQRNFHTAITGSTDYLWTLKTDLELFSGLWQTQQHSYYAPIVAFCQSTMTGAMYELSHHFPTVYMCLRPRYSSGYPAQSRLIHSILCIEIPGYNDRGQRLSRIMFLLLAIVQTTSELLKTNLSDNDFTSFKDKLWSHSAEPTNGEDFWANVSSKYATFSTFMKEHLRGQSVCLDDDGITDISGAEIVVNPEFETTLNTVWTEYTTLLNEKQDRPFAAPWLVLAVDEASNLLPRNDDGAENPEFGRRELDNEDSQNGFRDLRKVLRALGKRWPQLFAICTDTASPISVLAENSYSDPSLRMIMNPNQANATGVRDSRLTYSGRLQSAPKQVFKPRIRFLTMHIHASALLANVALHSSALNETYFSKFGRPYWYQFYNSSVVQKDYRHVLELAISKINARAKFESVDDDAIIAALTMVYDIGIEASSQLARDLVQSRCAILASISHERDILQTNYASGEFPLVHAAHELLRRYAPWRLRWSCLSQYSRLRSLNIGSEGELLGRIILTQAYVASVPKSEYMQNKVYWNTGRKYPGNSSRLTQTPTFLVDYLLSLTAKRRPDPARLAAQLGELALARIHLLQWVTMTEHPSLLSLAKAWLLGCGLICRPNTTAIDLLIPVVMDTLEPPHIELFNKNGTFENLVDERQAEEAEKALSKVMSVISIQIKNRQDDRMLYTSADRNRHSEKFLNAGKSQLAEVIPYFGTSDIIYPLICIHMSLGLRGTAEDLHAKYPCEFTPIQGETGSPVPSLYIQLAGQHLYDHLIAQDEISARLFQTSDLRDAYFGADDAVSSSGVHDRTAFYESRFC